MGFDKDKRPSVTPGLAEFVQTATTQATALLNRGISLCSRKSSVGTSTQLYTLNAPTRAGLEKLILIAGANAATSSRSVRVTAAAGSGFLTTGASTGATKMTFKLREWGAFLVSQSTKSWIVSWLSSRPGVLS